MDLLKKIGKGLNPLNDGVNNWYNNPPMHGPLREFASSMVRGSPYILRDYAKCAIRGVIVGTLAGYMGNKLSLWDINPLEVGKAVGMLDMLQYFSRKVTYDMFHRIPSKETD
jgi:hypothetical protein